MPFFIRNKNKKRGTKRNIKGKEDTEEVTKKQPKLLKQSQGEEIQSDSDIESDQDDGQQNEAASESSSDEETAQEKRLRLAKKYLSELQREEAENKSDDEDLDRSIISNKLKQQFLEKTGRLQKDIARSYSEPTSDDVHILRGHQLTITCLVITSDDRYIFSAGKDCSIIKWDVMNRRKVKVIPGGRKGTEDTHTGHTDHILAMAISSDDKFLVTGDKNNLIYIWDPDKYERLKVLRGHRDSISGLAFRKGSHQLFSTSHDRTVKIWSLDEMAYIETLFGHDDIITGVDSLSRERAITAGGRDNSIRIWKVIEESQLVFHGHSGSIDCVALINEENFISGSDDNSLCLWSIQKKKPLCTIKNAHPGGTEPDGDKSGQDEHWITCVASLQTTDLVASGSNDGCLRLWQCGPGFRTLTLCYAIPLVGFVNSIKFSSDGLKLVAGVGKEHRLGRWWSLKKAKNSVCVITLKHLDTDDNSQKKSEFGVKVTENSKSGLYKSLL